MARGGQDHVESTLSSAAQVMFSFPERTCVSPELGLLIKLSLCDGCSAAGWGDGGSMNTTSLPVVCRFHRLTCTRPQARGGWARESTRSVAIQVLS